MTRHRLSDDRTPVVERECSAEEFFERFPEEYQQSRDSIRKLVELLRKRLAETEIEIDEVAPDTDIHQYPEDVYQAQGWPSQE